MTKALVLFSGGLDSLLAIRVMQDQPVEVEALHGVSLFTRFASHGGKRLWPAVAAERLGVKLHLIDTSQQILDTVNFNRPRVAHGGQSPFPERAPEKGTVPWAPHGFGSDANPCIDCRMAMLQRVRGMMEELGASFLVTGEVVGQRPMSQRLQALRLIDRTVGLEGLVLRPLTALNLPPTIPEERGWVDRSRLHGISGRGRKPQMALAAHYGITEYATPAGGCLLTDPNYGRRILDLLRHGPVSLNDAHLAKMGRHVRLGDWGKAIVGRNERENPKIVTFARDGEWLVELADLPGPITLVRAYADVQAEGRKTGPDPDAETSKSRGCSQGGQSPFPEKAPEKGTVPSAAPEKGTVPSAAPEKGTLPSAAPEKGTVPRAASEEHLVLAARITARYTKARGEVRVCAWRKGTAERRVLRVTPIETTPPSVETLPR
jgi:tRNA-specific 2-thiouridylase